MVEVAVRHPRDEARRVHRQHHSQALHHCRGERGGRDHVPDAEHQRPARPQHPRGFGERRRLVREEHRAELADHHVEALVGKGQLLRVRLLPRGARTRSRAHCTIGGFRSVAVTAASGRARTIRAVAMPVPAASSRTLAGRRAATRGARLSANGSNKAGPRARSYTSGMLSTQLASLAMGTACPAGSVLLDRGLLRRQPDQAPAGSRSRSLRAHRAAFLMNCCVSCVLLSPPKKPPRTCRRVELSSVARAAECQR